MPSRSSPKPVATRSRPVKPFTFFRRHWILAAMLGVLLFLFLAGTGLWYWSKVAYQQELAAEQLRFSRAEKDVDRITAAVIAVAGQPLKAEEDKSCFLRSSKELKQPISCSIFSDLYYEVASDAEATEMYKKIKAATDDAFIFSKYRTDNTETIEQRFRAENISHTTMNNGGEQIFMDGKGSVSGMDCSMNFSFYEALRPPVEKSPSVFNSRYLFEIGLTCDEDAKSAYYPIHQATY